MFSLGFGDADARRAAAERADRAARTRPPSATLSIRRTSRRRPPLSASRRLHARRRHRRPPDTDARTHRRRRARRSRPSRAHSRGTTRCTGIAWPGDATVRIGRPGAAGDGRVSPTTDRLRKQHQRGRPDPTRRTPPLPVGGGKLARRRPGLSDALRQAATAPSDAAWNAAMSKVNAQLELISRRAAGRSASWSSLDRSWPSSGTQLAPHPRRPPRTRRGRPPPRCRDVACERATTRARPHRRARAGRRASRDQEPARRTSTRSATSPRSWTTRRA